MRSIVGAPWFRPGPVVCGHGQVAWYGMVIHPHTAELQRRARNDRYPYSTRAPPGNGKGEKKSQPGPAPGEPGDGSPARGTRPTYRGGPGSGGRGSPGPALRYSARRQQFRTGYEPGLHPYLHILACELFSVINRDFPSTKVFSTFPSVVIRGIAYHSGEIARDPDPCRSGGSAPCPSCIRMFRYGLFRVPVG